MKIQVKISLIVITLAFINSTILFAQNQHFYLGPRIGIGESVVEFEAHEGERGGLALAAGLTTAYQFNPYIGITSDLLLVSKGGKFIGEINSIEANENRTYTYFDKYRIYAAELPVALKLSLPVSERFTLKAYGGPSFQFQLYGTESREFADRNYQIENSYVNRKLRTLNPLEYGLIYGGGFEMRSKENQLFFLDIRTNTSLSEIGVIQSKRAKTAYYMLSVGCLF